MDAFEKDPSKCQELDVAMGNQQCMRLPGHDGPHDALGDQDVEVPESDLEDQVVEGGRVMESGQVTEGPPTRVDIDLDSLAPVSGEPVDLVAEMYPKIVEALARHAQGERVEFLVASAILPVAPGQFAPALGLTVFLPSMEIGRRLHGTLPIQEFHQTQEQIDQMVYMVLENLRQARAAQVSQIAQQQAQAKASVNGLILGQQS